MTTHSTPSLEVCSFMAQRRQPARLSHLPRSWVAPLLPRAAGVAAVGAAGTVIGLLIHQSDSDFLDEQIDEGHLLLFVRTSDTDRRDVAMKILSKQGAFEPKVYSVAACR